MEIRTWKYIPEFEGYYKISTDGLVKSVKRSVFSKRHHNYKIIDEKMLKTQITRNGYEMVCLSRGNNKFTKRVHRIVADAFLGEVPDGLVVHHKDHNKLNNHLSNLEIVSKQKNTQEYYKTLGKSMGKVPINDIPIIINRVSKGEQVYKIATEYGVGRNDIAVLCKIIALTGSELTLNR